MTLSKTKLKYLKSLQLKKFRQKYNNFVVEGDKIARELIYSDTYEIESLYAIDSWINTYQKELETMAIPYFNISITDLKRISSLTTPNKVFIVMKQRNSTIDQSILKTQLSLYLDAIQDPGNLGTILRIANWFGIKQVFCSPDCVDIYNPKVVQASMGAFLRVAHDYIALEELVANQAVTIYGAVLNGNNIYETPLKKDGLIVIGNEGKGIRNAYRSLLDYAITIPSYGESGSESLNAAVATGIVCAAFRAG